MLGRFFRLEGLLTFAGLFLCGAAVATVAGAPTWAIPVSGAAAAILLVLPVGVWVQEYLMAVYVDRGAYEKAVDLAMAALESAPAKRLRDRAHADLGLIQIARGDHAKAKAHLEKAAGGALKSLGRAVVDGHLSCALAHLGTDLDRAEQLAAKARREVPEDEAAVFDYFVGLVALKKGDAAKARELIAASLKADTEERDPSPGERRYVLAQALQALGEKDAARAELEKAAAVRPESHFVRLAATELAKEPAAAAPKA